jgi:T5SS/PEP-CTERM-associated repeat protein
MALISAVLLTATRTASADVTAAGSVIPNDPGDPWAPATTLIVGGWLIPPPPDESRGEVTVSNRGTLITPGAIIGASSDFDGAITVDGYGSRWINHGAIVLSDRTFSRSLVVVRHGARVDTDDIVVGSRGIQACARLVVEGYDATLTSTGTAIVGRSECDDVLELKDGGSFFSNNVYLAATGETGAKVFVTGYGTRWVSTGEFIVGQRDRANVEIGYQAKLSTVNAQIASGQSFGGRWGKVHISGWGATWTDQGLLRIGRLSSGALLPGSGELSIGTYGTLETEDAEVNSELGNAFIHVDGFYASWHNHGDASILGFLPAAPSLLIDNGGRVRVDGTLTLQRQQDYPYSANVVARLVNGSLTAGAIEALGGTLDFAGGRLNTAAFIGDLENTQLGVLGVGGEPGAYPFTSILGDYTQGSDATLRLTVTTPGTTPLLDVAGSVSLDGRLLVRAAAGVAPFQAGDTVTLLGWNGDLTGSFALVAISLPLAPGLAWDTSELYTTGAIHAVPSP